jgi:hypothetical protein
MGERDGWSIGSDSRHDDGCRRHDEAGDDPGCGRDYAGGSRVWGACSSVRDLGWTAASSCASDCAGWSTSGHLASAWSCITSDLLSTRDLGSDRSAAFASDCIAGATGSADGATDCTSGGWVIGWLAVVLYGQVWLGIGLGT